MLHNIYIRFINTIFFFFSNFNTNICCNCNKFRTPKTQKKPHKITRSCSAKNNYEKNHLHKMAFHSNNCSIVCGMQIIISYYNSKFRFGFFLQFFFQLLSIQVRILLETKCSKAIFLRKMESTKWFFCFC